MAETSVYDVAILGGGPGGMAAATQVARRGGTACLVEADRLGGVCLNVGCMPTKAMLAGSRLCWEMRRCERFGLVSGRPSVDGEAFMRRVRDVVATLARRAAKAMTAGRNVRVVRGRGRLVDAATLDVATGDGHVEVKARSIVIATGARPVRPDFLPWDSGRLLTSDEAAAAADLPESILVMGGGVIGCEFATAFAELGIETHLVEMLERLLPGLDKDASAAVAASLADRGVEVMTARRVTGVTADDTGATVALDGGGRIRVDRVLVAVGRQANIDDIGLENVAVETAGGIIPVSARCRTNVENVYAVGDVAEHRQYAHLADRMGLVAAENALGHDVRDDRAVVPVGAYTHPEVASVGTALREAKEQFGAARAFRYAYGSSGMALASGQTDGQLKVVADPDSGRIYGAVWIGPHATDMIQEMALAMRHGLTLEQIHQTIHAHPTFQEAAAAVASAWAGQARRKRP